MVVDDPRGSTASPSIDKKKLTEEVVDQQNQHLLFGPIFSHHHPKPSPEYSLPWSTSLCSLVLIYFVSNHHVSNSGNRYNISSIQRGGSQPSSIHRKGEEKEGKKPLWHSIDYLMHLSSVFLFFFCVCVEDPIDSSSHYPSLKGKKKKNTRLAIGGPCVCTRLHTMGKKGPHNIELCVGVLISESIFICVLDQEPRLIDS